jgi:hypothetical protein
MGYRRDPRAGKQEARARALVRGTARHRLGGCGAAPLMPIPRIPDDDARQVRAEYEADPSLSFERLADRWGWSASALCKAHKRAGGVPRPKGIEPRRIAVNDSVIMTLRQRSQRSFQRPPQMWRLRSSAPGGRCGGAGND